MATPTTLAELAPFWRADDNEGVSLESVSKEIAAYKPGGTFAEDYAAFVQLLQVVAHPKVGAVAIAKPGDKAEGDEGEEKAENSRVGVRNHVVDVGTAKCLSCARRAAHRTRGRRRTRRRAGRRGGVQPAAARRGAAPDAEAPGDEAAPRPDPACVFARFLAENVPARAVSLRGDGLGDGGARAVADALARNTWVLTLNLFDDAPASATRRAVAAHEAALGRLADLNKAIASGKKPKAKPGELRPPLERGGARARRRASPSTAPTSSSPPRSARSTSRAPGIDDDVGVELARVSEDKVVL
ncbi:hypothetical protein SO694_00174013 [Aureococcus anophagefferens]|uniref:Uncharacterized protein n=1 Tax=Aureococcus anophagefferens TaxID=44056 RepID=A0ABR1FGP4_AURAN